MFYNLYYYTPTWKSNYRQFKTLSEAQNYMKRLLKKGYRFATIEVWDGQKRSYINTLEGEENE